jgi:hypothetical protein
MHKKNQWQCTVNCKNGSGWDTHWGRIPLSYNNKLAGVNCQNGM